MLYAVDYPTLPVNQRYTLGICQDYDVKGTSFVLPGTQRQAEFEVALRCCSRDANDDDSRIHTATRSDCSFLCIIIRSRTSRQTRQLLAKVVSFQHSSHPDSQIAFLTGVLVLGTFHRYFCQWPDAPGEGPTSSVGNRAPCNLKKTLQER